MYKDILTQANLSPSAAVVYEYLLKNGESLAGQIIKKTPLKRGSIYNALEELINKGLAAKKIKNKVAWFLPNHPDKLREYLEHSEAEILKAKNSLESNLPALVSDFNLVSGQPGIRIFEGDKGIIKVTDDSLSAQGYIYTYSDHESVMKNIPELNLNYIAKRKKMGVKKRLIYCDNPYARNYLITSGQTTIDDLSLTQIKLFDNLPCSFNATMQIYNNKISYITFAADKKIGVIIEDESISKMHKNVFEYNWVKAKTLSELIDLEKRAG